MRREILLPPKHSVIFKSSINIPVPSLLFFSDCATCITSAAASLTTKSSFCSSRITHFHRPRVSDSPIFICGEKLEVYFLHAFKEVRELCFHTWTQHTEGIGKPLGKRLAIWSKYFQHVWTLSSWQTQLGLNTGQQIREWASLSGLYVSREWPQFSTISRSVEFLFGNFKNSVAGDWPTHSDHGSAVAICLEQRLPTKLSSATASSAGHKCHSLLETANDPTSQGSTCHLLLPHPPVPTTHQHALPALHPLSAGNRFNPWVITRTQLRVTREKCQEEGAPLVTPKHADSTHPPSGNSHLTSQAPLANPHAIYCCHTMRD